MRVLYYNWVDYLNAAALGGGVTVYQRNVIESMRTIADVEVAFLSSGSAYSAARKGPYWRALPAVDEAPGIRRFEIVNSGVTAPSMSSFSNPAQVSHEATSATFLDFLEKEGPFDVVHFNNLEGLPADVLSILGQFPETKVIYSLHNYYPFCAQVNLWAEDRQTCTHFDEGRGCLACDRRLFEHSLRIEAAVDHALERFGIGAASATHAPLRTMILAAGVTAKKTLKWIRKAVGLGRQSEFEKLKDSKVPQKLSFEGDKYYHQRRRLAFIQQINANCDMVLGVSQRVCTIARSHGINPDILRTSYIGTSHAERWSTSEPKDSLLDDDGNLTLVFLGYTRRDKGYFFLTHALRALPEDRAKRIRLRIFARARDVREIQQAQLLSGHLGSVEFLNGYSHDQLDALLQGVDVGVVPVLWEDNLPQVAIEMHARHIPLLTSDLGGAAELGRSPYMVFRAGSIKEFHSRIENILDGKISATDYWANAIKPVSNKEHIAELLDIYSEVLGR